MKPEDRRILNRLQEGLPFVERPWEVIAKGLGIEEASLLERIAFLKKQGIIRRISAVFTPRKIKFVSTLMAARVSPANLKEAVAKINSYPEVTHNYKRDAGYNIWFTLVARNNKRIAQIRRELKRYEKIEKLLDLPAVKIFKIDVNFKI